MTNAKVNKKSCDSIMELKVYVEFPKPEDDDNEIKKEVKAILANTLQEQMKKIIRPT